MLRQFLIATTISALGSSLVFGQSHESNTEDAQSRYTTVHTVLWVAGDLDKYLDEEQPESNEEPARADLSGIPSSNASGFDWSGLQADRFDYRNLDPPIEFATSVTDWSLAAELQQPTLLSLGHLDIGTTPTLDMGEPPSFFPEDPRYIAQLPQQWMKSLSDWQFPQDSYYDLLDLREQPSIAAAPVVAAVLPTSTFAENAGLSVFLIVMITPFAWLGWQEYQELQSRSHRIRLQTHEETVGREQLEVELREMDIEVPQPEEAEVDASEVETFADLEIAAEAEEEQEEVLSEEPLATTLVGDETAASDDDCEYELGVLEEANSLLATAASATSEESDALAPQADAELSGEDTEALDLTLLRGVGEVTRDYLASQGIRSLQDMDDVGLERIQEILNEAGPKFRTSTPAKWLEQAREILGKAAAHQ